MKKLFDCKEDVHKCSKCGLCQAVCPIYHITGNDCTVSRGQFIMLKGIIDGKFKMSRKINHYLDLCLKCSKCSKFCPSGIDVVDIIASAKHEFFELSCVEKLKSFLQKYLLLGIFLPFFAIFSHNKKSKKFPRKVLYFGGCGSKLSGNAAVVSILNKSGIELITPSFHCCGIPYFTRGDLKNFEICIKKFIDTLKKYNVNEIITTCSSCEKALKSYSKWCCVDDKKFLEQLSIKNIYQLLRENNCKLKIKNNIPVTYHKPCNLNNFSDVEYILSNIENLNYIKSDELDKCCGMNGLFKFSEYPIMFDIFKNKRNSIIKTGAKYVLTSCFGCKVALKIHSFGKYKVENLINFLYKHL